MQNTNYTKGMNVALGTYLKSMREGRGLKPSQVLAELSKRLGKDIAWSRLSRTEKGEFKVWPDGDFLTALYDIVQADLSDVAWIQRNANATAEDGERLAIDRLRQRAEQIADRVSPGEIPEALSLIRELRSNPDALNELRQLLNDGSDDAR